MDIKSIAGEFKTFVLKGNVVDLAVGVVIGAAFGKVVESVVKDLITPFIGMMGGQPDFSAVKPFGIGVGNFINADPGFAILAAVVFFLVVKPMNALMTMTRKKAEEKPADPPPMPDDVKLLMEIRDLAEEPATVGL
jgi:large conductance mechanosensitive channel